MTDELQVSELAGRGTEVAEMSGLEGGMQRSLRQRRCICTRMYFRRNLRLGKVINT